MPINTIPHGIPGRLMAIGDLAHFSEDDRPKV